MTYGAEATEMDFKRSYRVQRTDRFSNEEIKPPTGAEKDLEYNEEKRRRANPDRWRVSDWSFMERKQDDPGNHGETK